jgi:peptidoglycan pentaglycine glycine transferase (the first glycine)
VKAISYSFEELDKEKWATLENNAQNLSVLQTHSWAKVLRAIGTEPRFFVVTEDGNPLLGLLMFRSRLVSKFFSGYEIRRGPVSIPNASHKAFLFLISSLRNLIKRGDIVYLYWEPAFYMNLEPYLREQRFLTIPSSTFIVDLSSSVELLWKKLEKRARWGVRKAKKMNVTVSEAENWREWMEYHNVYAYENYRKRVRPRSLSLHRAIYQYLLPEGKARLFLAEHNGKTIAGSLFLCSTHEMIYYENASNAHYLDLQPNNVIQWEAILWAKQRGMKYYDLGGTLYYPDRKHPLYGVHVFKKQWGGRLYRYASFALNRLYVFGRSLSLRNRNIQRLYYSSERLGMIQRFDRGQ